MKKIIVIAAAALLSLVSCAGGSVSPKDVAEFNAAIQTKFAEAGATLEAIEDEDEAEAFVENFYEEIKEYCLAIVNDRKAAPELRVAALLNVADNLEVEEFIKYADKLPAEARESEQFKAKMEVLDKVSATGEGKMFTDFEVDGVKFSDFVGKGKYILVDFWASWCGPCRRELPFIKAVYEKYAGDDFDVLGLAVWDKPEDTAAAIKEHGLAWNQIVNCQRIPTDIYGVEGIPQIMLIGPDGIILKRNLRQGAIEEAVSEALGR